MISGDGRVVVKAKPATTVRRRFDKLVDVKAIPRGLCDGVPCMTSGKTPRPMLRFEKGETLANCCSCLSVFYIAKGDGRNLYSGLSRQKLSRFFVHGFLFST